MICGAPKVRRQPDAVLCIWKDWRESLWRKPLLTLKGPQPMLTEPELEWEEKCFSTCSVLPWNYGKRGVSVTHGKGIGGLTYLDGCVGGNDEGGRIGWEHCVLGQAVDDGCVECVCLSVILLLL
jgi:hypothetical protein